MSRHFESRGSHGKVPERGSRKRRPKKRGDSMGNGDQPNISGIDEFIDGVSVSGSCCGEADAYWADAFEATSNGDYIAIITDPRDDEPLGRIHRDIGTRIEDQME